MTLLATLISLGLIAFLGVRYLWLWYMTACWEQMVTVYLAQSGRPVSDVDVIAPTSPALTMILTFWVWYYPAFILNQESFDLILDFYAQSATVPESTE